ncbi:2OG-Fe(II) oxygenase [Phenylobacterium deserti]|uniref:2OG-Fe(II) oxygenase n=1 Tax=Phenylobacterium deserti TaxID=1914756 RepID=A0A328AC97_9CAUL|nr:2OG-Fe(II) oxygenase [Phenylobacterium deserti]RAK52270.1 2OG-Fe(II) oxygenase [Phenylobacterium deserti]
MSIAVGEPVPWFRAATPSQPEFSFDTVAGRYVLMVFLPRDADRRGEVLAALSENLATFDNRRLTALAVVRDAATAVGVKDLKALHWILDLDDRISRKFDVAADDGVDRPAWLLLDPTLRLLRRWNVGEEQALFAALPKLPPPERHAGPIIPAPVLIAPRIFEPAFCQQLIDLLESDGGGAFSGVMRDRGQRTVVVMDDLKKRRDVLITDPDLQTAIRRRLKARLFPMINRAFGFKVTRIERYLVSCYAAEDGGVFHAHRDNTTQGTAHRKFAGSINLNDSFEGGDLRFPEFGPATYRPPVGGSCVFGCGLLHEATPVTSGRRYAFLPFFYDEAGQSLLDAYRERIAETAVEAN